MIICPNCHHEEIDGEIFCSNCGSQLTGQDGQRTQAISQNDFPEEIKKSEPVVPPQSKIGALLALLILDAGQILPLTDRREFIIGRISEGQTILPDIDLTAYKAYEKGVSRQHISIKKSEQGFFVTDLGSVNGTQLNGRKLLPSQPYLLANGDILALGKLKIQVLIRK
jgi:hypothetical protein